MTETPLPPLPKTNLLYLIVLFILALGFYALILASLAVIGYALYSLVLWTPEYLRYAHTRGAFQLLGVIYLAVGTVGWALLCGLAAKAGGEPFGYKTDPRQHPRIFDLLREVAGRVGARPIQDVYITPEDEIGVWEETAIYLPPGLGKRRLVLGMGALNYLTLDQLRSILAHEYGHFSNKDTFFGRFIYQIHVSYDALIYELHRKQLYFLNPVYWILFLYFRLYDLIAAASSRNQEFRADRFAVEAYGRQQFSEALSIAFLEGSFFNQVGMREVWMLAERRQQLPNLYHFVGVLRRVYEREHPDRIRKILSHILAEKTGAFDSHPSLRERLRAQNVPTANLQLPPPPRPAPDPHLDPKIAPELMTYIQSAPPCAAAELLGGDAVNIQRHLSDLAAGQSAYIIQRLREAARES